MAGGVTDTLEHLGPSAGVAAGAAAPRASCACSPRRAAGYAIERRTLTFCGWWWVGFVLWVGGGCYDELIAEIISIGWFNGSLFVFGLIFR